MEIIKARIRREILAALCGNGFLLSSRAFANTFSAQALGLDLGPHF